MREIELKWDAGLKLGLCPTRGGSRRHQGMAEVYNLRVREEGLERYEPMTNPLTGITVDWPFPQLFVGSTYRILATRTKIYEVNPATWALTEKLTVFGGYRWSFADFGSYFIMTNGMVLVYIDLVTTPGVPVYAQMTSSTTIPSVGCLCNFNGQLVAGNVLSAWYDCGPGHVIWSDIGSADFTPNTQNIAGYMKMPWYGEVYQVLPLYNSVVVYGENGIVELYKHEQTFGLRMLSRVGLASRYSVAGSRHEHVFVDAHGYLWKMEMTSAAGRPIIIVPKLLGYKEWMTDMTAANIVATYDDGEQETYISDGTMTFLLARKGLGTISQCPTTVVNVDGADYGVFTTLTDGTMRLVTDLFDFNNRAIKYLSVVEVGGEGQQFSVAVDYRYNVADSWVRTSAVRCDPRGVATVSVAGVEFRLVITAAAFTNVFIDYLIARVKIIDKSNIRGFSSVSQTYAGSND